MGTHTPENPLHIQQGTGIRTGLVTWLKLKGKKEESNNIMITEVKLLTVKAIFNILYLCNEVINKAIYDFEPYLANNLQKRFRDFYLPRIFIYKCAHCFMNNILNRFD